MAETYKNLSKLIAYSKDGILSKVLSKNNAQNLTLFCMAAGTEISKHTSTKAGFVLVLEGQGVFNLAGEKIKMETGILIEMPANAVHSLKAEKDTSFLLVLLGKHS